MHLLCGNCKQKDKNFLMENLYSKRGNHYFALKLSNSWMVIAKKSDWIDWGSGCYFYSCKTNIFWSEWLIQFFIWANETRGMAQIYSLWTVSPFSFFLDCVLHALGFFKFPSKVHIMQVFCIFIKNAQIFKCF